MSKENEYHQCLICHHQMTFDGIDAYDCLNVIIPNLEEGEAFYSKNNNRNKLGHYSMADYTNFLWHRIILYPYIIIFSGNKFCTIYEHDISEKYISSGSLLGEFNITIDKLITPTGFDFVKNFLLLN